MTSLTDFMGEMMENVSGQRQEAKVKQSRKNHIRNSIHRVLAGSDYYESCLGYSGEDLRQHLSNLFHDGMDWQNFGEWQIDHIIPVSIFMRSGIYDVKMVNSLSNLRPVWTLENASKGTRIVGPAQ